uniref:UDP-glucuronic acid decarboxylase 1 n=1 Tax=Globodera rostochiensis TaxID=31243 RepID=A0A914I1X3_GLORO
MKVFLFLSLTFFGAILLFIVFLSSRLFALNDLSTGVSRPVTLRDEIERLKAEVRELNDKIQQMQNNDVKLSVQKISVGDYPPVRFRNEAERKRILITGGAGFVGSHLVDRLMADGHEVIALDNFFTGRKGNVGLWLGHPNFELVHHDIVNPFYSEVDQIYHLASPASPPHYMYNPVKTLKTNIIGTINMLGLARRVKARLLFASSSEVYGDPEISPQPESYFGRVNTVGPRSCYDEGKRAAEALLAAFNRHENVDIRIARIFNTFGPRMHINDGRVVSNFITQALKGEPITIYGDGLQTRSFQYISDLVDGLVALMDSNATVPVNIGNPEEHTILHFSNIIRNLTGSNSEIVNRDKLEDDPQVRRPDIRRAAELVGWKPKSGIKIRRNGQIIVINYLSHN